MMDRAILTGPPGADVLLHNSTTAASRKDANGVPSIPPAPREICPFCEPGVKGNVVLGFCQPHALEWLEALGLTLKDTGAGWKLITKPSGLR